MNKITKAQLEELRKEEYKKDITQLIEQTIWSAKSQVLLKAKSGFKYWNECITFERADMTPDCLHEIKNILFEKLTDCFEDCNINVNIDDYYGIYIKIAWD